MKNQSLVHVYEKIKKSINLLSSEFAKRVVG